MGKTLLRLHLMTICSLGAEWKDPAKIPVAAIIEEWRAQSNRGRYEGHQWSAAALDQIAEGGSDGDGGSSSGNNGGSGGGGGDGSNPDLLAEVDNREAAGLFAWLGR